MHRVDVRTLEKAIKGLQTTIQIETEAEIERAKEEAEKIEQLRRVCISDAFAIAEQVF